MVNKFCKQLFVALTIASSVFSSWTQAAQSATSLCVPSGYTVGFFNGVWNSLPEAILSAEELSLLITPLGGTENTDGSSSGVWSGEQVGIEVFYNTTGKVSGTGAAATASISWQDVAEVFNQRSTEAGGALQNRFEYFWDALSNSTGFWDAVAIANDNLNGLRGAIVTDIKAKAVASIFSMGSNPPTEIDYARHNARIDTLVAEKQKLLFVAHSQGNLFANHAYHYARNKVTSSNVKVVHVAPASTVLNGAATLSVNDLVINGLGIFPGGLPAGVVSVDIPFSTKDPSGHKFVDTYLDSEHKGRAQVLSQVTTALNNLQPPSTTGTQGFFTVTLTWDGYGDVDLHTIEPSGYHVWWNDKFGLAGTLDLDVTDYASPYGFGPEHYYASCDSTKLATGTYQFGINNYRGAVGRLATVQVSSFTNGDILTKSGVSVGPERGNAGNSSSIPVVTVNVSKDSLGKYSVSAK